ncbi:MAG: UDP-N-acetylmuramoyl-L-alanine--D-glutamate ligase [Muribaculaceae bacterium]|nr:UDP-N-acetylmuramoyl-L-alanine--D-glutamate ligase [Muribaculaceae bacterium]
MKRLVILGGGESGYGAAVLGKKLGMDVFLSDSGRLKEAYREKLEAENIPFEEGGHTEQKVLQADIVVKSPGIPDKAPLVKALREKGVPVVSEIEFAARHTEARMICITGSNGKTTTTSLIYHIMKRAGLDVGLAGNIGKSLALQVAREPKPTYVIELSSFQLDGMYEFKADIAVLMNITPDHLDRYDYKMQNYVNSKFRILQNQTSADWFVYWADDPVIGKELAERDPSARRLPFSSKSEPGAAAYADDSKIAVNLPDCGKLEISRSRIPIKGLHNMYNCMAAALACGAAGVAPDRIADGILSFEAVPHRLEAVGTINGAVWINDSKATNVASTYYALESMTTPTVLILGGTDKGNDYSEILPFVKEKVKAIVAMGVDNAKILKFFSGEVPEIVDTHSLADAVAACRRLARPGDTVLLSPCCASFDLFRNYEERGDLFRQAVKDLEK